MSLGLATYKACSCFQGNLLSMSGQESKWAPSLHTPSQQASKQATQVVDEAATLDNADGLSPLSTQ